MTTITALLDACVLYPAPLRSFMMHLATNGLFLARWTVDIHEEWMRNAVKDYPGFTREKAERVRDLMNSHVPECLVTDYEPLIPTLTLPDPDDRHVLAAAIAGRVDVIVTSNLADFPAAALGQFGLEARHPDEFVLNLFSLAPDAVIEAARLQRVSMKKPPQLAAEYMNTLERQGLTRTVVVLRQHAVQL